MFKIWVKTIVGEKLTRNHLWTSQESYEKGKFREYIYEICRELDIPAPVIVGTHMRYFEEFNVCRFKDSDFVESVDFEAMTVEYCIEQKKKDLRFYP